jgi:predicted transcriptional regulator with HTH domain
MKNSVNKKWNDRKFILKYKRNWNRMHSIKGAKDWKEFEALLRYFKDPNYEYTTTYKSSSDYIKNIYFGILISILEGYKVGTHARIILARLKENELYRYKLKLYGIRRISGCLRILIELGLVCCEKEGAIRRYKLTKKGREFTRSYYNFLYNKFYGNS